MNEPAMVAASTPKLRPVGGTVMDSSAAATAKRMRFTAANKTKFYRQTIAVGMRIEPRSDVGYECKDRQ